MQNETFNAIQRDFICAISDMTAIKRYSKFLCDPTVLYHYVTIEYNAETIKSYYKSYSRNIKRFGFLVDTFVNESNNFQFRLAFAMVLNSLYDENKIIAIEILYSLGYMGKIRKNNYGFYVIDN